MKSRTHRVLLAVAVALLTTGCIRSHQLLVLNPDGSGRFEFEATVDGQPIATFERNLAQGEPGFEPLSSNPHRMLVTMLANARGVDVWSSARAESVGNGETRYRFTGYFGDLRSFRAPDPLCAVLSAFGMDTLAADLQPNHPEWKRTRKGNLTLEYATGFASTADRKSGSVPESSFTM